MQLTLVTLLDTQLADVFRAPVIADIVVVFEAFFFTSIDTAEVPTTWLANSP